MSIISINGEKRSFPLIVFNRLFMSLISKVSLSDSMEKFGISKRFEEPSIN